PVCFSKNPVHSETSFCDPSYILLVKNRIKAYIIWSGHAGADNGGSFLSKKKCKINLDNT
ncbi:MAG: hypothetical protein OES64_07145, partial [Desulfobacteraceae bacterium]|nr:hypothetical protein [Desulfobacteraceae bacterium]